MKKTISAALVFAGVSVLWAQSYAAVDAVNPIATVYTSQEAFLEAEADTCAIASDGVNSFFVEDGTLVARTKVGYTGNERLLWECIEKRENLEDVYMEDTSIIETETMVEITPIADTNISYSDLESYLAAEGYIAASATDGVNILTISNGEVVAQTEKAALGEVTLAYRTLSYIDSKISELSQNDKSEYNMLLARSTDAEKAAVARAMIAYEKIEARYTTRGKALLRAKFIEMVDEAQLNLSMQTPADAAMNDADYSVYKKLGLLEYSLRLLP